MKQNIFRLISLIVSLIIGTVMAFAQTYVYELVTLDEVKLGGEFIVATSNDLKAEGTYVMNGIGGTDKNGIISGSLSKELVSYHKLKITPKSSGTYFDLNIDGTNIFRLENNLCWKNYSGYNKEWLLEDGLNSNTIVIKMKKPETRFLAFSDGVTGFKLYTEGYGVSELYFFKEVEYHEPEQTMGNITMSDAGFSTYYVDHTFIMPEGLTGGIVTETVENINAGEAPTYQLIYDWGYTSGTIVPAFTPIILKGKSGIYVYEICDKDGIVALQQRSKQIYIHPVLMEYIASIAQASRNRSGIELGLSPRGSLALLRASQAFSLVQGREFVTPEDIKAVAEPVIAHRLAVNGVGGTEPQKQAVKSLMNAVPVPTEEWRR